VSEGTHPGPLIEVGTDTSAPIAGVCDPDLPGEGPFADCVEDFSPAAPATYGHAAMPDIVLGPPEGGGAVGGLDVASLGCGGSVTLFLGGDGIRDAEGDDLIVYENPFPVGDETFAEPARVGVSADGITWYWYGCEVHGDGAWPPSGCAGIEPVATSVDPGDPGAAGGDAFDLAPTGLAQASWVRLVDRTREYYGEELWCEGDAAGFDLDAIAAVPR
jgi:hypothetical protein